MPNGSTRKVSLAEFEAYIFGYAAAATRTVTEVHIHHTWRPDYTIFNSRKLSLGSADAAAMALIDSMHRFHTSPKPGGMGWSDIAQHLTIDPEGGLWTGRGWNRPPASATGHNGGAQSGPFMIEMIGNFDTHRDQITSQQKAAVHAVTALVQRAFKKTADAFRFHNEMTGAKSCPGTAIDRAEFLEAVELLHKSGARSRARHASDIDSVTDLSRSDLGSTDEGELPEEQASFQDGLLSDSAWRGGGGDGFDLNSDVLRELSGHIINMQAGRFSTSGAFETTQQDVSDLVHSRIREFIDTQIAKGAVPRIMVYAHGGVTSERDGLRLAWRQISTWKRNGVYPVFLVWETGIMESFAQLAGRIFGGARPSRGWLRDRRDDLFEAAASVTVKHAWDAMKVSAERVSDSQGGGTYFVGELSALLETYTRTHIKTLAPTTDAAGKTAADLAPELHLVGHSAGTILMNHFVRMFHRVAPGAVKISSLQYLAPACTISHYQDHLEPVLANASRRVSYFRIFNLTKTAERGDTIRGVYEGSILYLVRNALEPRNAPLLGLMESVNADADLTRSLSKPGRELFTSPVDSSAPVHVRACSTSHGFDADHHTMNALLCRVLGVVRLPDVAFDEDTLNRARNHRGDKLFTETSAELEELLNELSALGRPSAPPQVSETLPVSPLISNINTLGPDSLSGRAYALCMGINNYASSPLQGCVPDMQAWRDVLKGSLGIKEVTPLADDELTLKGLTSAFESAIAKARPGDLLVIQYSGHGTYRANTDKSENEINDQGLVPQDADRTDMLWDDDLARIYAQIPNGVHAFVFMDCCHSGTNMRMGVGGDLLPAAGAGTDRRVRFYDLKRSPQTARARLAASQAARTHSAAGSESMRHVQYSACEDHEFAWESGKQGDFTRVMLELLREMPTGLSNHAAQLEIERRMRKQGFNRQSPRLHCTTDMKSGLFLPGLAVRAKLAP